jgi:putative ABC transport system substrate-binding protein
MGAFRYEAGSVHLRGARGASATCAEAAERVWRLGLLTLPRTAGNNAFSSITLPYLATRGFVEGRNLIVDVRVGTEDQMPALAQALVGDKPDVIVASSDWSLHAARAVTKTIPIVAAPMGTDPVVAGVAESWAHPGGNVTGVCLIAPELEVKRLALLHEALPSVRRVAVLAAHRNVVEAGFAPLRKAAAEAGRELIEIWVENPSEYAAAFDAMRGHGAEALVIVPLPELHRDGEVLAALSAKAGLPTIGGFGANAQQGLMIGYGPSLQELGQQAAGYVERIFNGAAAGGLPFQGPIRFDFTINMKTAKALGVTIPPSVLVSAEAID